MTICFHVKWRAVEGCEASSVFASPPKQHSILRRNAPRQKHLRREKHGIRPSVSFHASVIMAGFASLGGAGGEGDFATTWSTDARPWRLAAKNTTRTHPGNRTITSGTFGFHAPGASSRGHLGAYGVLIGLQRNIFEPFYLAGFHLGVGQKF